MSTKRKYGVTTLTEERKSSGSALDNMYEQFTKTRSQHTDEDFVEEVKEPEKKKTEPSTKGKRTNKSQTEEDPNSELEQQRMVVDYEMKKRIFLKIANALFTGFHVFIFNLMSEYKITYKELKLDADELNSLDDYVTEEMVKLIDLIPAWVYPVIHIETLFIDKWKAITSVKEKEAKVLNKKNKDAEDTDFEEVKDDKKKDSKKK